MTTKERDMTAMNVAILAVSSLSLITSAATLTVVLVGGRKMQSEVEAVKTKTNKTVLNFKSALENLEL